MGLEDRDEERRGATDDDDEKEEEEEGIVVACARNVKQEVQRMKKISREWRVAQTAEERDKDEERYRCLMERQDIVNKTKRKKELGS